MQSVLVDARPVFDTGCPNPPIFGGPPLTSAQDTTDAAPAPDFDKHFAGACETGGRMRYLHFTTAKKSALAYLIA